MILAPEACKCAYQTPGASVSNSPICGGMLLFMTILEGFLNGRCDIADPCGRVVGVDLPDDEYDFVVVGAGAAGPIVASRLSENSKYKVLLIEAGGPDPVASRVPSFYRSFWNNNETDWMYRTVVSKDYCRDQKPLGCWWPRGKAVGGSTVLNGMMYNRGHPADYDEWVNAGAKGWSWDDNLPYFNMSENNQEIGTVVRKKYHSTGGPMPIQRFRHAPQMVYDLINAINETGLPIIEDINDLDTPEGFAIAQTFTDDGQRYSVARAYLKPEWERPNLHTLVNAQVTRVLFKDNRAEGVKYILKGKARTVQATKEVILSAGALNSPNILLHSGVGPLATLKKFEIPVVANLPVGMNLRNHVGATFNFLLEKLENDQSLNWAASTEYLLTRNGSMTSTGITQLTGLLYSSLGNKGEEQPDLQLFFNGFYDECSATGAIGEPVGNNSQKGMNISVAAVALRPRSVGYLTLNSSDPLVPPIFYPNFFSHKDDMVMVKDGAKIVKKIVEATSLQTKYGIKLDPAFTSVCKASGAEWSDKWLECIIRVHTDPQNHQLGTAAINRVVDTQLRVLNTSGLRVIDASVMPTAPTGNPQAAIMMIAERGAAMIKDLWK